MYMLTFSKNLGHMNMKKSGLLLITVYNTDYRYYRIHKAVIYLAYSK